MKILIAGDWHSELHEVAVYQALQQLGHEMLRFSWNEYFKPKNNLGRLALPLLKAQNKYMFGPMVARLNRDFISQVENEKPDLIFVYRGTHIYPETLRRLKQAAPHAVLVGYNNDDPFSPFYPKWKWRHFLAGIPEYSLVLAFRQHNLEEFRAAGAKRVEMLRHWFIPERNHPVELSAGEMQQFGCDVVFVGHYEDDGRLACLEEIARRGYTLRIFGPGYEWDPVIRRSQLLNKHIPVNLVWGGDYNRALCGAKIALCFFSKLNRDTYTTRCFEIPASGTVLMSEYSDDLAEMFRPDQEAVFFHDAQELLKKLDVLLVDEAKREKIAAAGMKRAWNGGHDVTSRMNNMMGWVDDIMGYAK